MSSLFDNEKMRMDLHTITQSELATPDLISHKIKSIQQLGFFYLEIDNGHLLSLMKTALNKCQSYFSQSTEIKMKDLLVSPNLYGYLPSGLIKPQKGTIESKESYTHTFDSKCNTEYYNQYIIEMRQLAIQLLRIIINSLNAQWETVVPTILKPCEALTLIHYSDLSTIGSQELHSTGISEHTDLGYLTLLYTTQSGLEIKTPNGWMMIPVKPNCLIVNFGDMLSYLTCGQYQSTIHRVKTYNKKYSITYFYEPDPDILIHPVNENKQYPQIYYHQLFNQYMNQGYAVTQHLL